MSSFHGGYGARYSIKSWTNLIRRHKEPPKCTGCQLQGIRSLAVDLSRIELSNRLGSKATHSGPRDALLPAFILRDCVWGGSHCQVEFMTAFYGLLWAGGQPGFVSEGGSRGNGTCPFPVRGILRLRNPAGGAIFILLSFSKTNLSALPPLRLHILTPFGESVLRSSLAMYYVGFVFLLVRTQEKSVSQRLYSILSG